MNGILSDIVYMAHSAAMGGRSLVLLVTSDYFHWHNFSISSQRIPILQAGDHPGYRPADSIRQMYQSRRGSEDSSRSVTGGSGLGQRIRFIIPFFEPKSEPEPERSDLIDGIQHARQSVVQLVQNTTGNIIESDMFPDMRDTHSRRKPNGPSGR